MRTSPVGTGVHLNFSGSDRQRLAIFIWEKLRHGDAEGQRKKNDGIRELA
jgi:hypothetical protein